MDIVKQNRKKNFEHYNSDIQKKKKIFAHLNTEIQKKIFEHLNTQYKKEKKKKNLCTPNSPFRHTLLDRPVLQPEYSW